MEYRKGDRVRHPAKDDWGIGEVLADSEGDSVRVFFVGPGKITLKLTYVQPVKVFGDEASHPLLDNLNDDESTNRVKYQNLPRSIRFFMDKFPEGFYGKKFNEEEREYKDKAHVMAQELLGKEQFGALLENKDYAEIVKRALKVVNSTNLIFPTEKTSLKGGLESPNAQEEFSKALFVLLFGDKELEQRFNAFARVLANIKAAKWTIATYFLFFMYPDEYMFVKPTVIQYASGLCRFEVNYDVRLNWLTYKSVLDFSGYLFSEISEIKPRDMIDVQSFMWRIAPETASA